MELNFKFDESIKSKVKVGVIQFDKIKVIACNKTLLKEIDSYCSALREKYESSADALDYLKPMRSLYRTIGLDPTKNRPSSEALLRRVLKGKGIYQINSIVDICNLCSLTFLLSIGLYDVEKIEGKIIELRLGRDNEGYAGIGKEYVNVSGRFTLADKAGPFGNPSSDSDRTKITLQTQKALFVVFATKDYDHSEIEKHINLIESTVHKYHQCETTLKYISE